MPKLTQNIDGLERMADIPEDKLVECHGHFRTASCIECGAAADIHYVQTTICVHQQVPICQVCSSKQRKRQAYVKPDIVFFGEQLPERFHQMLPRDLEQADLCLILGTSLQVPPVARIPDMVNCPCVLLNREHVGGIELFHAGDCDDSVLWLAKLLGWHDELLEKYQRTRQRRPNNDNNKTKEETAKEEASQKKS